jgi:hypothetical protein
MKRIFIPILGYASMLAMVFGCAKEESLSPMLNSQKTELSSSNPASISEVKSWYENQVNVAAARGLDVPFPSKKGWLPLIDWASTKEYNNEKNHYYITPILNISPNQFASISLKGSRRLIVWFDKYGNKQANIVEVFTINTPLNEEEKQNIYSEIGDQLQAGKKLSLGKFNGNVIIYSPLYQFPIGGTFQNGRPVGSYSLRVTKSGTKNSVTSKRFASTLTQSSSCNPNDDPQNCTSYCGTVTVGGSTGEAQCIRECTGGAPGTGGGGETPGDGGGGYGGDGSGTGGGTTSGDLGELSGLVTADYYAGKMGAVVEASPSTNSIDKVELYYSGVTPGSEIKQLGEGVKTYNALTRTYHIITYFQVTGLSGSVSSRAGRVDIHATVYPDMYTESGYRMFLTMRITE